MRWRLTGTSWGDGQQKPWQVVPSLTRLLIQVDAAYPARHGADGTAAGAGHLLKSPKSDHNPDINGDVRAADIGEVTEDDAFALAEAIRLSRDPRIKYVIHERRMFSSYNHPNGKAFEWRSYSGTNGHWSHVHVSVYRINQNDTTPWDIGDGQGSPPPPEEDDMELVKAHQTALNVGGFVGVNGRTLSVDGVLGPNTQYALNSQASAASVNNGMTEGYADGRYVRKGQPVTIKGTT